MFTEVKPLSDTYTELAFAKAYLFSDDKALRNDFVNNYTSTVGKFLFKEKENVVAPFLDAAVDNYTVEKGILELKYYSAIKDSQGNIVFVLEGGAESVDNAYGENWKSLPKRVVEAITNSKNY